MRLWYKQMCCKWEMRLWCVVGVVGDGVVDVKNVVITSETRRRRWACGIEGFSVVYWDELMVQGMELIKWTEGRLRLEKRKN